MKLFNMLESVFFVTLGISCVLLMLLIYHFNQRLTKLEQSSETMFELLSNIVSELSGIKQTVINEQNPYGGGYPSMMHSTHKIPVTLSDNESEENSMPGLVENIQSIGNIEESDMSDDESQDDESNSETDSDDESEDNSDDESEDNSDDESEDNSDNESIKEEQSSEVKVVSVDMDNTTSNDDSSDINDITEELPIESLDEPEVQPVELDTEKIDEILVNKLDMTNDLEESASQQTITSNSIDIYKKMNVPSLKSLIIEKGLCSDPSKMKKNELIALLETNI